MKYKKTQLALLSIVLAGLAFCVFFKIERRSYSMSCAANITLVLNKVIKNDVIYPTELISVDLAQKTATIQVKFPKEGWKEFKGQEKEWFEEIGYYIDSLSDDRIEIFVPFPKVGYKYRLRSRW